MKHKREFDTSYFHNPVVQGVNYSLLIMLLKEMESKGQPRAASTVSPLLSSQSSDQFCVFCVSPPPHREITQGVMILSKCANLLGLQVQSDVAREFFSQWVTWV
jgi:hypothetical protein